MKARPARIINKMVNTRLIILGYLEYHQTPSMIDDFIPSAYKN